MTNRPIAPSLMLALLGAAAVLPSAQAQRRGSAAGGRVGGITARPGIAAGSIRMARAGGYYGGSGLTPYFYPDYDSSLVLEPPPRSAGIQIVPSASPALPPAKPSEALVLELQGDRWVRITPYAAPQNYAQSVTQAYAPRPQRVSAVPAKPLPTSQAPAASAPATPPPAVLVFRDGHQEQIGQYRIMGANIYLNTDYWTSGAWTRTVPIAELDVPATLRLNQQRGANFRLPSGPDEVMIGG